ncbi:MAG: S1/P1 nuclease [Limisphaerales bacterium]
MRRDKKEWDGLGGNYIVLDPTTTPPNRINMHAFWDQLPGVNPSYQTVATLADKLENAKAVKKSVQNEYRNNKTIPSWVQESYHLAVQYAYDENRVTFAHVDDLKSGKVSEADIPKLRPEYIQGAHEIAERRLILAGQRLTDHLKKALQP